MSNQKCFNCGADYGLHHHETNQFPLGGYESHPGPQQWQETTFEERGQKLKELAASDMYEALKQVLHISMNRANIDTQQGYAVREIINAALSKAEGK